jgi:hypothetical protein
MKTTARLEVACCAVSYRTRLVDLSGSAGCVKTHARWTDAAQTAEWKSGSRQREGWQVGLRRRRRRRRQRGCASQSARRRHRGTMVVVLPLPPHAPARLAPIGPWPLRLPRRSSPAPASHPPHPAAVRERPAHIHVPRTPASALPHHPRSSAALHWQRSTTTTDERSRCRCFRVAPSPHCHRARSPPRRVEDGGSIPGAGAVGSVTLDAVGLRASDAGVETEEAPRPAMVPNSHCGDNTASSVEPDVPPAPKAKSLVSQPTP